MRIFMVNKKVIGFIRCFFIGLLLSNLVLAQMSFLLETAFTAITGGLVIGMILAQIRRDYRGKLLWASKRYRE